MADNSILDMICVRSCLQRRDWFEVLLRPEIDRLSRALHEPLLWLDDLFLPGLSNLMDFASPFRNHMILWSVDTGNHLQLRCCISPRGLIPKPSISNSPFDHATVYGASIPGSGCLAIRTAADEPGRDIVPTSECPT